MASRKKRPTPLSPSQRAENAAFLCAIRAALDDDAPRLLYADWLEEQGDPSRAARAQAIRIWVMRRAATNQAEIVALSTRAQAIANEWSDFWKHEFVIGHDEFVTTWNCGFPGQL